MSLLWQEGACSTAYSSSGRGGHAHAVLIMWLALACLWFSLGLMCRKCSTFIEGSNSACQACVHLSPACPPPHPWILVEERFGLLCFVNSSSTRLLSKGEMLPQWVWLETCGGMKGQRMGRCFPVSGRLVHEMPAAASFLKAHPAHVNPVQTAHSGYRI